jgi:hypothetical protein
MWHGLTSGEWWTVDVSAKERPPLDFMGPYNVPRSDIPDNYGEAWVENDKIKRLPTREFDDIRAEIVAALSKHGAVYGESEGDHDFFVYDDKFFDRTQKIELETTDRLAKIIVPAVAELQRVLRKRSLWRVMFIGDGHDSQAHEEFFVVYPDVVRIRQLRPGKSVDLALVENVQVRLRHQREREDHQGRRIADLKNAVIRAFSEMDDAADDVRLVAWFTTVSALDWDWGCEGKPGTSVWLLLRGRLPDKAEGVQSDLDLSVWWASPDGTVTRDEERPPNARQLLHFEDDQKVSEELAIAIMGQPVRIARPRAG